MRTLTIRAAFCAMLLIATGAAAQTDVLYRLSQLLKIQPEFIDRVLASAAGPLD